MNEMTNATESNDIPFLVMPPLRLFLLVIGTLGLYGVFWFYKNWQAVKVATDQKMLPFWRAIFSIFYCFSLFKIIAACAGEADYAMKPSATTLAVIYIVAGLAGNGASRTVGDSSAAAIVLVALSMVAAYPLMVAQYATNHYRDYLGDTENHRMTAGEMVLIIFGLLIGAAFVYGYFLDPTLMK